MAKQRKVKSIVITIGSKVEFVEPYENQVGVKYEALEIPNEYGFVLIKTINQNIPSQFKAHILDLKISKK